MSDRTKAHQVYRNGSGEVVPGATTVLSVLNKPALVKWANKLGLQGIDSSKYVDKMASIGTIAHYLIECHLKGEKPDLGEYSKNDIDKAENALLKFFQWESENKFNVISSELKLTTDDYGGTIDCYAMVNGKKCLVDFKTSKAIYDEHFHQLAAYKNLLEVNGYEVEQVKILRIGRDENEGFEERSGNKLDIYFELFKHCLEIYKLQKILKG